MAAGLQGALVRTGKYRPGDEERLENTTATVFRNLEELSKSLKKS
ncbi:MAG: HAD hydrolase-like protein [Gammaproteobacteria bacterium]